MDFLPPRTKEILNHFLIPSTQRSASLDVLILSLYMQVARFLCWHRVKINNEEFPMMYAFNFGASGSYKDQPLEKLAQLIQPILQEQRDLKNRNFERRKGAVKDAADRYKGEAKKDYLKENNVIYFSNTMKMGTVQGLHRERTGAQKAELGHIHYEQSEIIDFIRQKDTTFYQIALMAKEAWNNGDTPKGTIVTEQREHVNGVPFTFLAHGSLSGFFDDAKTRIHFLSLLESGMAKRAFFLFNTQNLRRALSDEEVLMDEATIAFHKDNVLKHFEMLYKAICIKEVKDLDLFYRYEYKNIEVDKKVVLLKNQYRNECIEKASKLKDGIQIPAILDRFWRAYRLSASIATFEHPEDLCIRENDYITAMYLTERWGEQFNEFLGFKKSDDLINLLQFIRENPKTTSTTIKNTMGLRYASQVNAIIESLGVTANEMDLMLLEEGGIGKARYFSVIDIPKHKELSSSFMVTLSQGKSAELTEKVFEKKTCDWNELHKIVTDINYAWSPSVFKNNERLGANLENIPSLLTLDFDNKCESSKQFTIARVKEVLKDFSFLLYTTKSHLKVKGDAPANERFRLIIPVSREMQGENYKQILESVGQYFFPFQDNDIIDYSASCDKARLYFAHNGEYFYNKGKLLDWMVITESKRINPNDYGSLKGQPFPTGKTITLSNGHVVDLNEAKRMCTGNKTNPCFAVCHEDKTPSAFFGIYKPINRWIYHCSACNLTYF